VYGCSKENIIVFLILFFFKILNQLKITKQIKKFLNKHKAECLNSIISLLIMHKKQNMFFGIVAIYDVVSELIRNTKWDKKQESN